ncbi:sensor histidine kinase KdpD [Bacillus sp. 03113]|uniref:sensor histidine kinase n=1 Tax=Bacillus sp. 03113 TaxID=2578211 RepID=UPI00114139EF|nr:HAMP domain-containing sensor histidine kinase [Bacillus sp. 03113]
MKSIKRRLTVHFSLQFIAMFISIFIILVVLLFVLILNIVKYDMDRDFTSGALDFLATDTTVENGKATISRGLEKKLREENMWFQVVNEQGKVIGAVNTPKELPKKYNVAELLQMEETKQYLDYSVESQYESFMVEPTYYILGYKNGLQQQLYTLFKEYSANGLVKKEDVPNLLTALQNKKASLQIIDQDGKLIESFGREKEKENYKPLDVISRKMEHGKNYTSATVYHDTKTNYSWIMHTPNKHGDLTEESTIKKFFVGTIIVAATILLITILFSVWNAFRYGGPLLFFTSWLERMGRGKYSEVLTEKERKKIFRKKSGKVRFQYRLYAEVINAFYDMAERLSRAETERKQLEKTREEWMTGISHDLRTPLSTIQGYGHLLESGQYEWSEIELKEIGGTIRQKGEYMLGLVEDFSLAFKLKNNALALNVEKVNVHKLVQRIVLKFVNDRMIENVTFSFEQDPAAAFIEADQRWFERMLDNLLFNAIKHNPPNTHIDIRTKTEEEYVKIIISDNGVGMDEETRAKLFDRYYRGTNTNEQTEGAGLGMSIAKAISQLHHGEIYVESTVNIGTKITLQFPII